MRGLCEFLGEHRSADRFVYALGGFVVEKTRKHPCCDDDLELGN